MREEHDAVTSNGLNNDCTNKIHCSDSANNRNGDVNCNLNQISQVWGTWEELLLTCAVKRHGSKDWDSVAKEVRSRTSLNVSAPICKLKYQDLKRRFRVYVADDANREAVAEEDGDGEIPWLEQLRSRRIAELRREVQRSDDTILSLQLKVKKLEDEKDGDNKPDLEPLNDETEPARLNRETTESDHRSIHESNSTASVDKIADHERVSGNNMVHANENSRNPDPDPAHKEEEGTVSRRSETSHSGELGESGTSTGHLKRKGHNYSGEDNRIRGGSGGNIKPAGDKSQPLIEIIKLIRSHPRGSMFESRLRSQETKDYKRLIRQHLDIKTIEKKLENGSYVSSSLSFYRDLKILFTNAIVFFPSSSSEYMAAQELSTLVSNEMKKKTGKSTHRLIKEEAESSGPPLVVCKKKSSGSKNMVPSSSSLKQKDEKKSQEVSEDKKTVTTTATAARSSRRTSKGMEIVAKGTKIGRGRNSKNKQTDSSCDDDDNEEETHKTEKKIASEKKKKSVAEFLKRIEKNSPHKGKDQKKSDGNVKKETKPKPRELRSKKKVGVENYSNKSPSKRKQSKKEADEVTATAATGKRSREIGKDYQHPKKRSRR